MENYYYYALDGSKNNYEIVIEVVKNNYKIVIEAVKNCGYASNILQNNCSVILTSIKTWEKYIETNNFTRYLI
jgi:hypothetical protein